jgi:hypothetical protein
MSGYLRGCRLDGWIGMDGLDACEMWGSSRDQVLDWMANHWKKEGSPFFNPPFNTFSSGTR